MRTKHLWAKFGALGLTVFALFTILRISKASEPKEAAPNRKPGLWQIQLTLDDGSYAIPPSQMCIDASAEKRLTLVGAQMNRNKCATYHVSKQRDGAWAIHSVCQWDANTTVETDGVASGDFSASYSINATGVTTGSSNPARNGTHRVTISAKWLGSCPVGQHGGDQTSNGKTTNALER